MSQQIPMSPKQRNEQPQETCFDRQLGGAISRLDSRFLELLGDQKRLEIEQFNVRLLVICLRGVRHELLNTDAVRFEGLVKIIDGVLAELWMVLTTRHFPHAHLPAREPLLASHYFQRRNRIFSIASHFRLPAESSAQLKRFLGRCGACEWRFQRDDDERGATTTKTTPALLGRFSFAAPYQTA